MVCSLTADVKIEGIGGMIRLAAFSMLRDNSMRVLILLLAGQS
jgi:hypothetical protein